MEFLEFISIDPWHILFTWINLLLLVMLLKKFLFKPVNDVLAKRQAQVDGLYNEAETARTAAESDRQLYAEKLGAARQEADALMKDAAQRAGKKSDEMLAEAQQQVSRMKEKAEADIAQERLKAKNDVKNEVSQMVLEVAGKVIGRELNADDQAALIDRFIDEVNVSE